MKSLKQVIEGEKKGVRKHAWSDEKENLAHEIHNQGVEAGAKATLEWVVGEFANLVEKHNVYPMTPEQEQRTFVDGIIYAHDHLKDQLNT